MKTPITQSLLLIPILGILLATGCAQMPPHRTEYSQCTQSIDATRSCPNSSLYNVTNGSHSATLAVFEFDDQGYLATDRTLYEKNMQDLRTLHKTHGVLMVLFAHGWKHNADQDDGNIIEFEKALLDIETQDNQICEKLKCKNRKTVGVYLGWRGLSATINPFKQLSFWNRKSRAHRVGQDGVPGLLADLDILQDRNEPAAGDISRFIIIGHSFGGALTYSAVHQRLVSDLERPRKKPPSDGTILRNVADLIILVNPAFEAARFQDIHKRASTHKFPKRHMPILAVFTSEADLATKRAFPLGRGLSTIFTKYNLNYPEQAKANQTALGHYKPFVTHRLDLYKSNESIGPSLSRILTKACNWDHFQDGEVHEWSTNGTTLSRLPHMQKEGQIANPYLNVQVDEKVIC